MGSKPSGTRAAYANAHMCSFYFMMLFRAAIQSAADDARKQLHIIDTRRDEKRAHLNRFKAQLKFTNLQDLSLAVGKWEIFCLFCL